MPRAKIVHSSYKTHVRITDVQRQRNGVSGQPFWAVRFNEEATYDATQHAMLAVVFDEPLYCAVRATRRAIGALPWRRLRRDDAHRHRADRDRAERRAGREGPEHRAPPRPHRQAVRVLKGE